MKHKSANTRDQRLIIRQELLKLGVKPYPQDGHRTHTVSKALNSKHNKKVITSGRVVSQRGHGNIKFFDIKDQTGKVQIVFKQDETKDFSLLKQLGAGDFIRVTGLRFCTETGQESILSQKFSILAKAIRRIPQKRTGLFNEETRYRKRSLDLITNDGVVEVFKKRTKIIHSVRETLSKLDFLEVETPTLQPLYGGANARPFTTHINAWNIPLYLRISPELYLKYLIIGGLERVYEITKNFRNEGVDKTHNPEFTMMECYAAYWDYNDMMDLTEKIYKNAAITATGSPIIEYRGVEIDFSKPWKRLPMKEAIKKYLGINVDDLSDQQLKDSIRKNGIEYKGKWIRGLGIATLFEATEDQLIQPTFITDMPRETTSLCKPHRDDESLIERFEPYIMGWEVGNAYTELNDPVLQRQFWEEEREDDDEAHPLDETFIEAMEYGMPPTGGLGLGIDRMVMLLTNQTKIRDVILFPTMKPISK